MPRLLRQHRPCLDWTLTLVGGCFEGSCWGRKVVKNIAAALAESNTVKFLDLATNRVTAEAARALAKALGTKTSLTPLT